MYMKDVRRARACWRVSVALGRVYSICLSSPALLARSSLRGLHECTSNSLEALRARGNQARHGKRTLRERNCK